MLTFKAVFEGKLINLGKNINSLEDIRKELINRFVGKQNEVFEYAVGQQPVNSFEQLLKFKEEGKNSIKIQVTSSPVLRQTSAHESVHTEILTEKIEVIDQLQLTKNTSPEPQKIETVEDNEVKEVDNFKTEEIMTSIVSITTSQQAGLKEVDNSVFKKVEESEIKHLEEMFEVGSSVLRDNQFCSNVDPVISLLTCFRCQGKGVIENGVNRFFCETCEGKGQFKQDSPFIAFLDRFFFDRFKKHCQQSASQVKPEIPIYQPEIPIYQPEIPICSVRKQSMEIGVGSMERKLSRTLDYQADVHESHKRIREIELNKEFTQGYEFINTGDVAWPAEVEILDLDTKETETMVGLKPGQKMQVSFGPFSISTESTLQKKYMLSYVDSACNRVCFGNRFGFNVRGIKPVDIKKVSNTFRERIKVCKNTLSVTKSLQFLQQKLMELGISLENHLNVNDDMLEDILSTYK